MRDWFVVGCKLLGLFFLYYAFASILGSIGLIVSIVANGSNSLGSSTPDMFLITTFSIIANIIFALSLIYKTEWLADKFRLSGRLQDLSISPGSYILQPGIILIGIYIFCTYFGRLVHAIVSNLCESNMASVFAASQPKGLTFSLDFIAPVVTLVFSLLLIFYSKSIAEFLEKRIR
jgi:hypothetical protein